MGPRVASRPRMTERDEVVVETGISIVVSVPDHIGWDWRIGVSTDALCVALDGCEPTDGWASVVLGDVLRQLAAGEPVHREFDNESIATLELSIKPLEGERVCLRVQDWCGNEGPVLDVIVARAALVAALHAAETQARLLDV